MGFLYYENKLSPSKREVYRALVRGLSSYERSFSAPRIPSGEYGDILSMVKKDHPLIFGVESLSYRFYDGSSNVTVTPEYKMKKAEDENAFAHCRVPFMTGFRRRRAVCGRLERAGRRGDRRRPARANGAGLYGIPPRNATEIFARGGARGRHLVEWGA